jgi:hypothetical protein
MADRFLIAPLKSGLVKALPAWQIPEDAFAELRNAYVFRGRVRKRDGTELMGSSGTDPLQSRLRVKVATTDGSGNASGTVPGSIFAVGQQFSIGTEIFTVYQTGTPAGMLTTGSSATHTFNTTTGAYNFVGADATEDVFWYPGQPVMGITTYEIGPINTQPTLAFDTQFAYQYSSSGWDRSNPGGTQGLWHGDDYKYFWSTNWQSGPDLTVLYVTNFNAVTGASSVNDDPIWTWDGTNWIPRVGANAFVFAPKGAARIDGEYVMTARIIVRFQNHLVLLNTIENNNSAGGAMPGTGTNTHYPSRCRYAAFGSPLTNNAWYQGSDRDSAGLGPLSGSIGANPLDAPTREEIVSAEFIKDRLIVYFEESTWELAYTGNQIQPFKWQQINTELGAIGTFSIIPFDRAVLGIGATGVHSCSGANVERIDDIIPDQIFKILKKNGGERRIAGIRDYFSEIVYWSYPSTEINPLNERLFPDKILVYNYANSTWSIWDDTFTSYGYFYQASDVTWAQIATPWESYDFTWTDGIQYQQQRRVVAGNQQGYVLILSRDMAFNAVGYTITNAVLGANDILTLTIINHNFNAGEYIIVQDLQGFSGFVDSIFAVQSIVGKDTITILIPGLTGGPYEGGGTVARVSQVDILSKEWNPYIEQGRSLFLGYIDFCVERTPFGEITVDYYASSSESSSIASAQATGTLLGNNVLATRPYDLRPFEEKQRILWHRVYFQTTGEFIQIRLYWTDEQMRDVLISLTDFVLEGLILSTQPKSYTLEM